MPQMLVNGETLNYEVEGTGPVVMFVHSLGANTYMWKPIWKQLSERYCCIGVDCRGHGKSSYKGAFTVADVAADLNAVLDELEIKRVQLVGLSMGGPILLEMYAGRPGRIASLTIADGFYDNRATSADRIKQTEDQIQGKTMLQFGHEYAKSRLQPATPKADYDALAEAVSMVTPKAYLDTVRAISTVGFQQHIAAISVPTLILFGDKESAPLQQQGRRMAELIPGAKLEVIPGAGHLSSVDQPAKFIEVVGGFLDSVKV